MAEELLVGSNDIPDGGGTANYIYGLRKQAVKSSTSPVTKFEHYCYASSGNVKVAVYADNAGSIGSRLAYNNSSQGVVNGWNELSVSSHSIVSGTYYWLLSVSDTYQGVGRLNGGSYGKYGTTPITFSTFTWGTTITETAFADSAYSTSIYLLGETGGGGGVGNISDVFGKLNNSILLGGLIK